MINQDHSMNNLNKCPYPIPTKNLDHTHQGIKNISNMSLVLNQTKTNTKIQKFNPYQIKPQMQHPTHTPTENSSKTIPGNKPDIYEINIQHQELNKGMHIAKTLKGNLESQQKTNTSGIVKGIKAILKTPIQNLEKPIFLFRKTHEAAVRNSKILACINCGTKRQPSKLWIRIPKHSGLGKIILLSRVQG